MSRAEALAAAVEAAHEELAAFAEGLSPAEWRMTAVNHPERVVGPRDEDRPVGVVVHHTAVGVPFFVRYIEKMAAGDPPPPISFEDIDKGNAEHAAANPDPDQAETVALIRRNADQAVQLVRGLSEESLDRTRESAFGPMSTERTVQLMVEHAKWHLGSVRATVGR
jgi:hypothetical protein